MQVSARTVVSFHYTLTDDDGALIDSSAEGEPLTYLHGAGNLIPGLETALEGQPAAAELQVRIAPEQAYGERDDELVQPVPRSQFPPDANPRVGMEFEARTPAGPRSVTVVAVDEETVTVDANHPLAGKALNFRVTVIDVRAATSEEIAHGHVHGPGGHTH